MSGAWSRSFLPPFRLVPLVPALVLAAPAQASLRIQVQFHPEDRSAFSVELRDSGPPETVSRLRHLWVFESGELKWASQKGDFWPVLHPGLAKAFQEGKAITVRAIVLDPKPGAGLGGKKETIQVEVPSPWAAEDDDEGKAESPAPGTPAPGAPGAVWRFHPADPPVHEDGGAELDRVAVMEEHPLLGPGQGGLKAKRTLGVGERVAWYEGEWLEPKVYAERTGTLTAEERKHPKFNFFASVLGSSGKVRHVDGYRLGDISLGARVNHAGGSNANAEFRQCILTQEGTHTERAFRLAVVATREIPKEHEVLVDFGEDFEKRLRGAGTFVPLTPAAHLGDRHRTKRGRTGPTVEPTETKEPEAPTETEGGGGGGPVKRGRHPEASPSGPGPGSTSAGDPGRDVLRPHVCPRCGRGFTKKFSLNTHLKSHWSKQDRPRVCPFANCASTFSNDDAMDAHRRAHLEERSEKCSFCPEAFDHAATKKKHEKVHTLPGPHKCTHCNAGFDRPAQLTNHKDKAHPLQE